jgi:hypothetical protein
VNVTGRFVLCACEFVFRFVSAHARSEIKLFALVHCRCAESPYSIRYLRQQLSHSKLPRNWTLVYIVDSPNPHILLINSNNINECLSIFSPIRGYSRWHHEVAALNLWSDFCRGVIYGRVMKHSHCNVSWVDLWSVFQVRHQSTT